MLRLGVVIAVASGKGGTGKTSVCAGLSTALADMGRAVLCIDCDIGLRNLDISLGLPDNGGLSFLDVCQGGYPLNQAARHPDYPKLAFLTAPMNCPAEKIPTESFQDMLRRARTEFDYILLDAPAGLGAGFRLAASAADRCLVVTGAGPAAVRDAARVGEVLDLMKQLAEDGMTMVVVTHEMGFAREVASRVMFMADGHILEQNTPEEFFANPQNDRLKDFLSKVL